MILPEGTQIRTRHKLLTGGYCQEGMECFRSDCTGVMRHHGDATFWCPDCGTVYTNPAAIAAVPSRSAQCSGEWVVSTCGKGCVQPHAHDGSCVCEQHRAISVRRFDTSDAPPSRVEDDAVNHPAHYTNHPSGVECITITEHMNFCIGNVVKYLWRADLKNGLEDLKKAAWYINREIARREKVKK